MNIDPAKLLGPPTRAVLGPIVLDAGEHRFTYRIIGEEPVTIRSRSSRPVEIQRRRLLERLAALAAHVHDCRTQEEFERRLEAELRRHEAKPPKRPRLLRDDRGRTRRPLRERSSKDRPEQSLGNAAQHAGRPAHRRFFELFEKTITLGLALGIEKSRLSAFLDETIKAEGDDFAVGELAAENESRGGATASSEAANAAPPVRASDHAMRAPDGGAPVSSSTAPPGKAARKKSASGKKAAPKRKSAAKSRRARKRARRKTAKTRGRAS